MSKPHTPEGALLTELVLKTFRLNGEFLDVADEITRGSGLTAARWQVIGAVLHEPLPVASIARNMGVARQGVQRLADALVADGLCEYRDNPAHLRAKLVAPTAAGFKAVATIAPIQREWAARAGGAVGKASLRSALTTIDALLALLATPAGRPRRKAR